MIRFFAAVLLAPALALAGGEHQTPPVPAVTSEAVASAGAASDSASEATAEQSSVQTIESERQAPSTFVSTPTPTAPCYVVNSWSVGVPGAGGGRGRARRDDECWVEYVKQAEHTRAMDLGRLDIERLRVQADADRAAAARLEAEVAVSRNRAELAGCLACEEDK